MFAVPGSGVVSPTKDPGPTTKDENPLPDTGAIPNQGSGTSLVKPADEADKLKSQLGSKAATAATQVELSTTADANPLPVTPLETNQKSEVVQTDKSSKPTEQLGSKAATAATQVELSTTADANPLPVIPTQIGDSTKPGTALTASDAAKAQGGKEPEMNGLTRTDNGQVNTQTTTETNTGTNTTTEQAAADTGMKTLVQIDSKGNPVDQNAGTNTTPAMTTLVPEKAAAATAAAIQPVDTVGMSKKEVALLGSQTKSNVILLGEQVKPDIVQLGETAKPAVVQLGETVKPATVQLGETEKPAVVQLGNIKTPATVHLGEGVATGAIQIGNYLPAVVVSAPHYTASNPEVTYSAPVTSQPAAQPAVVNNAVADTGSIDSQGSQANGAQATVATDNSVAATQPAANALVVTYGVKGSVSDTPAPLTIDNSAQITLTNNGSRYLAALKTGFASQVDFYIRQQSLSALLFLGAGAQNPASGAWEFSFDGAAYPNGAYELFALIVNPGGTFRSPNSDFTINNISSAGLDQQTALKSQLALAQLASGPALTNPESLSIVKKTLGSLPQGVADPVAYQNAVRDFTSAISKIIELNNSLSQIQAQKDQIDVRAGQLKQKLAALSPDALDSLRNDIVAQINDLLGQSAAINSTLAALRQQLADWQGKRDSARQTILSLAPAAQKVTIQAQLTSLESSVGASAQKAVEAQNELAKDSDNDGLSDYDELFVYKTDPYNPDTDGDGFLDGDEVTNGFNPLDPGDHKKTVYPDPYTVSPRHTDIYTVDSVAIVVQADGRRNIKLTGHGLPGSYVDIFIYSQPLIVVVKTDSEGRWEYVLEKDLGDGQHTVYAAQINSLGAIEARSQEFVFLKAGASVTPVTENTALPPQSMVQQMQDNFGFYTLCIVLASLGVGFLIIGSVARKAKKESPEPPPGAGAVLK